MPVIGQVVAYLQNIGGQIVDSTAKVAVTLGEGLVEIVKAMIQIGG